MQSTAIDDHSICLSVCLSVTNGWMDPLLFGDETPEDPRNIVLDGVSTPHHHIKGRGSMQSFVVCNVFSNIDSTHNSYHYYECILYSVCPHIPDPCLLTFCLFGTIAVISHFIARPSYILLCITFHQCFDIVGQASASLFKLTAKVHRLPRNSTCNDHRRLASDSRGCSYCS